MNISKTLIAATLSFAMIGATTATASAHSSKSQTQPQHQTQVVRSSQACDMYARDYANWRAGYRGTRVAVGGLIGAGVGALVGGFLFGTPIAGAVVGAGAGVVGGAIVGQPQWQAEYNNAYSAIASTAPRFPTPGSNCSLDRLAAVPPRRRLSPPKGRAKEWEDFDPLLLFPGPACLRAGGVFLTKHIGVQDITGHSMSDRSWRKAHIG